MRWLWRCIVLVAGIGGWQLWASAERSSFFPPPSAIVTRMHHLWFSGPAAHLFLTPDATSNILPSLGRVLAGLAIATAEASRMPVAMNGAALGSDTMRIVASLENPNARLVSFANGSTSSIPAIVLYSTGQIAP